MGQPARSRIGIGALGVRGSTLLSYGPKNGTLGMTFTRT